MLDGLWVGGTERSLVELIPALQAQGVESSIACLRRRREGVEAEARRRGIRIHHLSAGSAPGRVVELRRWIRRESPDVVHSALFAANQTARFACRGTGVPLVTSLVNRPYGVARRSDPRIVGWKLDWTRRFDAWTSRWVDRFHAVSRAARDGAVEDLGIDAGRIEVIERGRDPDRLGRATSERREQVRAELGIARSVPWLLSVGRQDFQKGQDVALRALPAILEIHPTARLSIVGREGTATDRLEELCRDAKVAGAVDFLGHRSDVPDLLAAADLLLFPSRYEGLPGTLIEALALELPVVASRIPSVEEVVEHDREGLLVPADTPEALSAATLLLLADEAMRRRFGEAGRRKFEDRFRLELSARRMALLYRDVIGVRSNDAE